MDLEVLHEVVTPTKMFSTGGDDTFISYYQVRRRATWGDDGARRTFFMGVDRADVSLEVFPPEETFSASKDIASEHPGL